MCKDFSLKIKKDLQLLGIWLVCRYAVQLRTVEEEEVDQIRIRDRGD